MKTTIHRAGKGNTSIYFWSNLNSYGGDLILAVDGNETSDCSSTLSFDTYSISNKQLFTTHTTDQHNLLSKKVRDSAIQCLLLADSPLSGDCHLTDYILKHVSSSTTVINALKGYIRKQEEGKFISQGIQAEACFHVHNDYVEAVKKTNRKRLYVPVDHAYIVDVFNNRPSTSPQEESDENVNTIRTSFSTTLVNSMSCSGKAVTNSNSTREQLECKSPYVSHIPKLISSKLKSKRLIKKKTFSTFKSVTGTGLKMDLSRLSNTVSYHLKESISFNCPVHNSKVPILKCLKYIDISAELENVNMLVPKSNSTEKNELHQTLTSSNTNISPVLQGTANPNIDDDHTDEVTVKKTHSSFQKLLEPSQQITNEGSDKTILLYKSKDATTDDDKSAMELNGFKNFNHGDGKTELRFNKRMASLSNVIPVQQKTKKPKKEGKRLIFKMNKNMERQLLENKKRKNLTQKRAKEITNSVSARVWNNNGISEPPNIAYLNQRLITLAMPKYKPKEKTYVLSNVVSDYKAMQVLGKNNNLLNVVTLERTGAKVSKHPSFTRSRVRNLRMIYPDTSLKSATLNSLSNFTRNTKSISKTRTRKTAEKTNLMAQSTETPEDTNKNLHNRYLVNPVSCFGQTKSAENKNKASTAKLEAKISTLEKGENSWSKNKIFLENWSKNIEKTENTLNNLRQKLRRLTASFKRNNEQEVIQSINQQFYQPCNDKVYKLPPEYQYGTREMTGPEPKCNCPVCENERSTKLHSKIKPSLSDKFPSLPSVPLHLLVPHVVI
ncbi:hypothetical protein FQA39_LY09275 [Lamprigera yunnana]|nr:hypothetical protein FQA39_LY09275 [Lamprigera yunnana]